MNHRRAHFLSLSPPTLPSLSPPTSLQCGDQILRINGYRLEDAVHKEFIQLVASQDRVTLKVRGVGMLPVKE